MAFPQRFSYIRVNKTPIERDRIESVVKNVNLEPSVPLNFGPGLFETVNGVSLETGDNGMIGRKVFSLSTFLRYQNPLKKS